MTKFHMKCFSHLRLQAGLESRSSKCPQASSSVIFCEWNPSLPPEPMVSEHTTSARPGQNIIPKKCNDGSTADQQKGINGLLESWHQRGWLEICRRAPLVRAVKPLMEQKHTPHPSNHRMPKYINVLTAVGSTCCWFYIIKKRQGQIPS